ncbi:hypothetical protein JCM16303_003970 [Sporobolomyces ruberrimus]
MAPLDPSHFSFGPVPYTSLASESEDPLHLDNDPYTPSPSYQDHKSPLGGPGGAAGGSSNASAPYRSNPVIVDGTSRSQIEFYEKELNYLRTENARLRDLDQQRKDKEVEQLRRELGVRKMDRDCRNYTLYVLAGFAGFILAVVLLVKYTG